MRHCLSVLSGQKSVDMIERLETMEELMSRVEQEQKSQKRGK